MIINDKLGVSLCLIIDQKGIGLLHADEFSDISQLLGVARHVDNGFYDLHVFIKRSNLELLNAELVLFDVLLVKGGLADFD